MEPLLHLVIPSLIALAFFPRKHFKSILLMIPFTFIMDFDFFINGYHRILFHNIFFIIIVALILYFALGKIKSLIASFFMLAHLIMDLNSTGVALFWPFYDKFIALVTNLTHWNGWIFKFDFITFPLQLAETPFPADYMRLDGFLILLASLMGLIIAYWSKKCFQNTT